MLIRIIYCYFKDIVVTTKLLFTKRLLLLQNLYYYYISSVTKNLLLLKKNMEQPNLMECYEKLKAQHDRLQEQRRSASRAWYHRNALSVLEKLAKKRLEKTIEIGK